MRAFYVFLLLVTSTAGFSQPQLLKDIHNEAQSVTKPSIAAPSNATIVTRYNNRLYFSANDATHGSEIWSTDGTAEGTRMLKDIYPGSSSFVVSAMKVVGDRLLIASGYNTENEPEAIYSTDGTEEGTIKLVQASTNCIITGSNGIFYFVSSDDQHGVELWRSDGTQEGTFMIKDIFPGIGSSIFKTQFFVLGNTIYFNANDGVHGKELWKTDGTPEGTTMVADINPDGNGLPMTKYLAVGNSLYFAAVNNIAGYGWWKIAGEGDDPVLVTGDKQLTGPSGSELYSPVLLQDKKGNKIICSLYDGNDLGLFAIDVNTGELKLLQTIDSNSGFNDALELQLVLANDRVYFVADNQSVSFLWSTDGTAENTVGVMAVPGPNVYDIDTWNYKMGSLTYINGNFYFLYYKGEDQQRTFTLASSSGGSFQSVTSNTHITDPVELNGKAFFFLQTQAGDYEPWISDGTRSGTHLLKDINTDTDQTVSEMTVMGDQLVFIDVDNDVYSLWTSKGTAATTSKFKSMYRAQYIKSNDKFAIFYGQEKNSPAQVPWVTDGTSDGTFPLKNFVDLSYNYPPYTFVGDVAYFTTGNWQLWKTDGTQAGTIKVANINAVPTHSFDLYASTAFKNELYFFAGNELWKSNGTSEGTTKIVGNVDTDYLRAGDNKLYFVAASSSVETKVYVTDGTPEGTHLARNISPSHPDELALGPVFNDVLYFRASDSFGTELWRSDGTEAGTYLLKDIYEGNNSSVPQNFKVYNGEVYFLADDGIHGLEMWKTDGTPEGTTLVKDIYPGENSPTSGWSAVCDNKLFFTANDGVNGRELWQTDGTEAGTIFLGDINPGSASAFGSYYFSPTAVLGKQLFFVSAVSPVGREIWYYGTPLIDGLENEIPDVVVWPNPATNTLVLKAPSSIKTAVIKDILGRDVLSAKVSGENTTIDVSHLPRGMYFVKMRSDDQSVITRKVILK